MTGLRGPRSSSGQSPSVRQKASAIRDTSPARLGAFLAVVMVVLAALVGAPLTDFDAKIAVAERVLALPRHRSNALFANLERVQAATGTIVVATFTRHGVKASVAVDHAALARFDTA